MAHAAESPRLSALVVAHNEEARLGECLAGLAFSDELVVVLDRCTDRSREIARGHTDRIVEGAWPNEGERRNEGIAACTGDWVLEVDADERVSPELAEEVRRTIGDSTADYHSIPVDNYIGRRLVRHGWGAQIGVASVPRLCRRGVKRWGSQRVHPALEFAPGARRGPVLRHALAHFVDRNVSDLIRRLDRYTTARAEDLRESGDIGSGGQNVRRFFTRFWKCFVVRKGYREGALGFLIALCAGLYPVLSYLKAREGGD